MSVFDVDIEENLLEESLELFDAIGEGLHEATSSAAMAASEQAVISRRYRDRTGNLTRSIGDRDLGGDATHAEAEFYAEEKYASFVEKGTAPHRIEARKAQSLRWEGSDGAVHFARAVNHPGAAPHTFMVHGEIKAELVLIEKVTESVDKACANMEKK